MKLAQHILAIQPPPITEVKSWIANRSFPAEQPLIDLCQAIPSYPPPKELIEQIKTELDNEQTFKYSPDEGLPEVREAVSQWYRRRYHGHPEPNEICLTIGASQAFWLAMTCLCAPGDEVIVQLPAYFDHPMGLQALGITPVYAPFDPQHAGLPDTATIAGLITDRTKAILLVSPSNPTGAVISAQQLEDLFLLAKTHNICLVLDETYNAFVAGQPHRLFSRSDWQQNFVHIASFGKTFALTGLRCGALIADTDFIAQALKIQDSMAVCQPRPAQLALQFGCQQLDDWVTANAKAMRTRHDLFKEQFSAADNPFEIVASGSFFAWIKHPWPELSARHVARLLADKANLLCLPGDAFGPGMGRYLRLAFGNITEEQVAEAVKRFLLPIY